MSMRKLNSAVTTRFISEPGSHLLNNDYFGFVELDQLACYVIADGINDSPDAESAKMIVQSVISKFYEHPSMKKSVIRSYLEFANKELLRVKRDIRYKASVLVIISNYTKFRYASAGNVHMRMYRGGHAMYHSEDLSLAQEEILRERIPQDALARHEERNNLRTYVGQKEGFHPYLSKKIRLKDGDLLALYTRGIWENLDSGELDDVLEEASKDVRQSLDDIEDCLLSKQIPDMENYTIAAISIDKVFRDPNRRRKIVMAIVAVVVVLAIILAIVLILYFTRRAREKNQETVDSNLTMAQEYIANQNYTQAKQSCEAAQKAAQKLGDKDQIDLLNRYILFLDAIAAADSSFDGNDFEKAQEEYTLAKERSRDIDNVQQDYIESQQERTAQGLAIYDLINEGDLLTDVGDYEKAEARYKEAQQTATQMGYSEGRTDAKAALETLYSQQSQQEAEMDASLQEYAQNEYTATELSANGDKSYEDGDYTSALVYYQAAKEKYNAMPGYETQANAMDTKIAAVQQKKEEASKRALEAEDYYKKGDSYYSQEKYTEARGQYALAEGIYSELGLSTKAEDAKQKKEDATSMAQAQLQADTSAATSTATPTATSPTTSNAVPTANNAVPTASNSVPTANNTVPTASNTVPTQQGNMPAGLENAANTSAPITTDEQSRDDEALQTALSSGLIQHHPASRFAEPREKSRAGRRRFGSASDGPTTIAS